MVVSLVGVCFGAYAFDRLCHLNGENDKQIEATAVDKCVGQMYVVIALLGIIVGELFTIAVHLQ